MAFCGGISSRKHLIFTLNLLPKTLFDGLNSMNDEEIEEIDTTEDLDRHFGEFFVPKTDFTIDDENAFENTEILNAPRILTINPDGTYHIATSGGIIFC
jgi:hypothetical protein